MYVIIPFIQDIVLLQSLDEEIIKRACRVITEFKELLTAQKHLVNWGIKVMHLSEMVATLLVRTFGCPVELASQIKVLLGNRITRAGFGGCT